jgi:hypothetical protein
MNCPSRFHRLMVWRLIPSGAAIFRRGNRGEMADGGVLSKRTSGRGGFVLPFDELWGLWGALGCIWVHVEAAKGVAWAGVRSGWGHGGCVRVRAGDFGALGCGRDMT